MQIPCTDQSAIPFDDAAELDARNSGFFTVDMPHFWERPELSGFLRDAREKPDRYAWLQGRLLRTPSVARIHSYDDVMAILGELRQGG